MTQPISSLPKISESDIQRRATGNTWNRARRYYRDGAVGRIVWQPPRLSAEVYGSQVEPYQVNITFDGNQIVSAHCTCPYDRGGDCKHIIAVLLHAAYQPENIEARAPVETLVQDLDAETLRVLVSELAAIHPHLGEDIERFVRRREAATTAHKVATPDEVQRQAALLARQIRNEGRAELQMSGGYDYYYDGDFSVDAESILEPAVTRAEEYIAQEQPYNALTVLEAATQAWEEASQSAASYVVEWVEDYIGEHLIPLAAAWSKALLTAPLSDEEKASWQAILSALEKRVLGGEALEMPLLALQQGWDYPPLVHAMQGDIPPQEARGSEEVSFFADHLTEVRLEILAQREDYQSYLNLARAEGAFLRYVSMLVQLGEYERATQEAISLLVNPHEIQQVAETLTAAEEIEKALRVGAHGLEVESFAHRKNSLAVWVRDTALANGAHDLALQAARVALETGMTLENYRAYQRIAGEAWDSHRSEALALAEKSSAAEEKVRIYLYEGLERDAMRIVDKATWFSEARLEEAVAALRDKYPRWCFKQYRRRAEPIMDAGQSGSYDTAAEWLRRGRDVLIAAGETVLWNEYLDSLLEKHWRKYKLRPMLEALREDPNLPPHPRPIQR